MVESCFARYAESQASAFQEAFRSSLYCRRFASWDEYLEYIPASAAAGTLDVVEVPLGWGVNAWAHFGYLQPLNPLLGPASDLFADIFLGALAGSTVTGSLYALPYAASPGECLLGFWPGRFDEVQLPYPSDNWTLTDLVAAAMALNEADSSGRLERYGYIPAFSLPGFFTVLRTFNVALINSDMNTAASPAELLPLLRWYDDQMHKQRIFARPFELPTNPLSLFAENQAAMFRISFGTLVSLAHLGIEAVLYPRLSSYSLHSGYMTGLAFGISPSSPNPTQSIKWCQYISNAEHGLDMLRAGCGVPGCRSSSWQNREVEALYPVSRAIADLASMVTAEAVPVNLRQQELHDTWLATTAPFWNGRLSVDSCAELISNNLNRVLLSSPMTELGG